MKYCKKCHKEIDTMDDNCPVCNEKLEEILSDDEASDIVATTTLLM